LDAGTAPAVSTKKYVRWMNPSRGCISRAYTETGDIAPRGASSCLPWTPSGRNQHATPTEHRPVFHRSSRVQDDVQRRIDSRAQIHSPREAARDAFAPPTDLNLYFVRSFTGPAGSTTTAETVTADCFSEALSRRPLKVDGGLG
jgi:hypothetical protein